MMTVRVPKHTDGQLPTQEHRTITVNLTSERLDDARRHGINVSAVCRAALEAAIKAIETGRPQTTTWEP